jgi:KUP system potassium uptake protein
VFLGLDFLFVSATSTKITVGGWVPLLVAGVTLILFSTWVRGHEIVTRERHKKEQTLENFVDSIKGERLARLPGHAVYLGSHNGFAPLALEASVHQLHELHEKVVIATVEIAHQPHVAEKDRVIFDGLKSKADGISHVTIRFGFSDHPNVPKALEFARPTDPEINFNPYEASYFVSQQKPVIESTHTIPMPLKVLYLFLARNAMNASDYYHLPPNTTIQMSTYVGL